MPTRAGEIETDRLLRDLYSRLRDAEGNRSVAKDLESALSKFTVEAEELILVNKHDSDAKAVYRRRRARLKRVADGFVWTALGFDEIRLLAYAGNPTPGYMAGKTGYWAERLAVDALYRFSDVVFVIQNDVTNILRVGDITVLLPNQTIKVIEVKSGSGNAGLARSQRQGERAKTIDEYLRSGASTVLAEGDFGHLQHLKASWSPTYYWGRLERVCSEALKRGVMWKQLDARVVVIAYRPRLLANLKNILGVAISSTGWKQAKLRIGVLSTHFEASEKASSKVRYIIPITAFRMDPEVVSSLLVGDLDVLVIVNTTAVVEALREVGMIVTQNKDRVAIQTETATLEISERSWNWVVYGLRTVSTLVESVQSVLSDPILAKLCGVTTDPTSDVGRS